MNYKGGIAVSLGRRVKGHIHVVVGRRGYQGWYMSGNPEIGRDHAEAFHNKGVIAGVVNVDLLDDSVRKGYVAEVKGVRNRYIGRVYMEAAPVIP